MRKFYKTTFTVEVLGELPILGLDLLNIHYEITEGDCSGVTTMTDVQELSGSEMAKELLSQGSDPEFFDLDADGNDFRDYVLGASDSDDPNSVARGEEQQ